MTKNKKCLFCNKKLSLKNKTTPRQGHLLQERYLCNNEACAIDYTIQYDFFNEKLIHCTFSFYMNDEDKYNYYSTYYNRFENKIKGTIIFDGSYFNKQQLICEIIFDDWTQILSPLQIKNKLPKMLSFI